MRERADDKQLMATGQDSNPGLLLEGQGLCIWVPTRESTKSTNLATGQQQRWHLIPFHNHYIGKYADMHKSGYFSSGSYDISLYPWQRFYG